LLLETAVVFKAANKQVKDSSFTTTRIDIHYAIMYILMIGTKNHRSKNMWSYGDQFRAFSLLH